MWHQHADCNAFEPDDMYDDTVNLSLEEQHHLHKAMFRSVYMHQNHLDNQVSTHLSNNCLVDARTLLDTEDRQDIMLDVDESFTFHDEDCGTIPTSNRVDVDDDDDALQFTDRLRGQHTAEEIMSLQLLKLLRAIGAPNYAYRSVMGIFLDAVAAKAVSPGSIFRQRETAIKHFANRFRLKTLYPTTLTKHMNGRSYPVVLHEAEVMINSLLKSALMVEENLLFPDMDNPFGPQPPTVKTIGDVDTGQVYRAVLHIVSFVFNGMMYCVHL